MLTIGVNDTVNFAFLRPGDDVISGANLDTVCPDGVNPVDGPCATATNPMINITGPGSGQPLFNQTVQFTSLGVFSVVNPTFCRSGSGFATVACSAKAFITVSEPVVTPAPGSTIIVVGNEGTLTAFPSPLVVTTGETVWFQFDIFAGVVETDSAGNPIAGGLSCPTPSVLGSFCNWTISEERSYYFRASPFDFGGRIDGLPNPEIPPGSFVIEVGQQGNSFTVPTNQPIPVGSMVFFLFNTYGPYRVQRGDGPTCQPFIGVGAFDSLYQAAGMLFVVFVGGWFLVFLQDECFLLGLLRLVSLTSLTPRSVPQAT